MKMGKEDKEYFEQVALKDQALRTMGVLIDGDKVTSNMKKSMMKNGMTENAALLSIMEIMESNTKR